MNPHIWEEGMRCPNCQSENTRVIDTFRDKTGRVRRRRACRQCGHRFSTIEQWIQQLPLVIKADGSREPFDREKILKGLRIACWKRPVSATDLERLVDDVEDYIRSLGRGEVPSRVIGDRVIEGLKRLDPVAYIRYAIVYLGLEDLSAVRREIDRLLASDALA